MAQDPRALLQKADKAASSASSGFSLFGARTDKYETACEAYVQAANAFRLQKDYIPAGQTFEKCAALQRSKLNEPDDAANSMVEAFKCYKAGQSAEEAARCLEQAIQHYTMKGNFRRAAGMKQQLAELYEVELGDPKRSAEAYEVAAGWFEGDGAEALANKLYLKLADLAALDADYYKSIANYEKVSRSSINNNLTKWSVKEYLLKAGICHLCTHDLVGTQRALESYRDLDPGFSGTREHQLLVDLLEAVEEGDQEKFADKLFQYDQMSKLDKWKTTLLLRVKEGIEEKGEDFS